MIRTIDLTFSQGDLKVLKGLNISFAEGEIVGITGASGSGKSTLIRSLAGRIKSTRKCVLIKEIPLKHYSSKTLQSTLSFYSFVPPENTEETVENFVLLSRLPLKGAFEPMAPLDRETALHYLEILGLAEIKDTRIADLSSGQCARALLAHSLAREREILLMEDPEVFLDLASKSMLHRTLQKMSASGRCVVIASNDINFLCQSCDRVIILNQGEVAAQEEPENITEEMVKKYLRADIIVSKNIYNGRPEFHSFPQQ